jgi:hypothetical protein
MEVITKKNKKIVNQELNTIFFVRKIISGTLRTGG